MLQTNANTRAATWLSAERIAHLESEIAAKKAEICQLQIAARGEEATAPPNAEGKSKENKSYLSPRSESTSRSLELDELVVLWEERLASMNKKQQPEKGISASAIHDAFRDNAGDDGPPDLVYTSSTDSDETRDAPPEPPSLPSPRGLFDFGSPRSVDGIDFHFDQLDVKGSVPGDRDQKIEHLKAVIESDTELIRKMKATILRIVHDKKEVEPKSSLRMIVGELESTIALQDMQNEIVKEECGRLQDVITGLEATNASKEIVINCMKAEMVKLQFTNGLAEEELGAGLLQRDEMIANLESSFKENADNSKRMIKTLGVQNSALEDEIENLKAENGRLQAQSQILEEEKRISKERIDREMSLFYIEQDAMSRYS